MAPPACLASTSPGLEERSNLTACTCCGDVGSIVGYGDCPLCDGLGSAGWSCVMPSAETEATPPWEVVEVVGKGRAVFATRGIAKGTLLFAEQALLSVPGIESLRQKIAQENEILAASMKTDDMRLENITAAQDVRMARLVATALEKLPSPAQDTFLSLSDCFLESTSTNLRPGVWVEVAGCSNSADNNGNSDTCNNTARGLVLAQRDGLPERFVVQVGSEILRAVDAGSLRPCCEGTLGGILLTNAVTDDGDDIASVYSQTSRLNHSCAPNAVVMKLESKRCVMSTQAIKLGEEICISYTEDYSEAEQHEDFRVRVRAAAATLRLDADLLLLGLFRQQLFAKWGFCCLCPRCEPIGKAADATLADWCQACASFSGDCSNQS